MRINRFSTLNDIIDEVERLNDELLDGDIDEETRRRYQKEYKLLRPLYTAILMNIVSTDYGKKYWGVVTDVIVGRI